MEPSTGDSVFIESEDETFSVAIVFSWFVIGLADVDDTIVDVVAGFAVG